MELEIAIIGIFASIILGFLIYVLNRKDTISDQNKIESSTKPIVNFSIYDTKLDEDKIVELTYSVDLHKFKEIGKIIYYEIPIGITNPGKVTIENIKVCFEFGPESPLVIENEGIKNKNPLDVKLKRKVTKQNRVVTITNTIKQVNPGIGFTLGEIIQLLETKIDSIVETKDGKKLNMTMNFHHKLKLLTSAKNVKSKKYNFEIRLINSKSLENTLDYFDQEFRKMSDSAKNKYENAKQRFVIIPEITEVADFDIGKVFVGKVFEDCVKEVIRTQK